MKRYIYMTVDTETSALPFGAGLPKAGQVGLVKPLVYDIGWCLSTRAGNILVRKNFLVEEIYNDPILFNTGFYAGKRPLYEQAIAQEGLQVKPWENIIQEFLHDAYQATFLCAYNAAFDMKAIQFTEEFLRNRKDPLYMEKQKRACVFIAQGNKLKGGEKQELKPEFNFRNEVFPVIDIWALSCERVLNTPKYKEFALSCGLHTPEGKRVQWFRTTAEATAKFLFDQNFVEDHTALSDAILEAKILTECLKKKGGSHPILKYNPFQILGTVKQYLAGK